MSEITRAADWEAVRSAFRWRVPEHYSIAEDMVGGWARAEPDRLAIRHLPADGPAENWTYGSLDRAANRLANLLAARGIARSDRVAVLLPQSPEVILTHVAAYRLGAVVVPLFTLFGPDGLDYRLRDAGVRVLVTDRANAPKIAGLRAGLPELGTVLSVDGAEEGAEALWPLLERAADRCEPVTLHAEDPAFISYTSGTTGQPKGALHAHRVLLGHLPGVQLTHEMLPQPGDFAWTPADWAWMGGLCNIAMPCLRFGVPVLSHRMERFDPERAFRLLAEEGIRNAFLPPTALKLMRTVPEAARGRPALRSVGSGGESLGGELLDWGRGAFGLTINEFYGQTECNLVIGNCASILAVKPGAMGKPYPGSEIAILGPDGAPLPPGALGEIAIGRGHAAMFLRYWGQPERTAEKLSGAWMPTGDEGVMDVEGYLRFASRTDDVITSSGYRIGPVEIEHCLTGHPAVEMAAVVGVADPVRTEIVKAYVTLAPGHEASDALAAALIAHVRLRLSPHLAPRLVCFLDRMPTTATGKLLRRSLRDRH